MKTYLIKLENKNGVLEKITNVFTRNNTGITSLKLFPERKNSPGMILIGVEADEVRSEKLVLQLKRIIEITDVKLLNSTKK